MHAQPPGGFRDVVVALLVDPLDMLPAHPVAVIGSSGGGGSAAPRCKSAASIASASAGFDR